MKRVNKRKIEKIYSDYKLLKKFCLFWYWFFKDLKYRKNNPDEFREFGLRIYTGRQGDGKTTAMIEQLERYRKRYPKLIIVTNFGYVHEDYSMESWQDLFNIRNEVPEHGTLFAIDEIQNEFSTSSSKNFPESLLGEITQQRKQKIKILATSQVFTRVAKPLREQTYEVCESKTILGRWTFVKCFDADDYNVAIDSNDPNVKFKLRRKWRKNFIQDNKLRELFNSYAKVERMKKLEYIREVR